MLGAEDCVGLGDGGEACVTGRALAVGGATAFVAGSGEDGVGLACGGGGMGVGCGGGGLGLD